MARTRTRTPQQRAARELARTPTTDPYRGGLRDPFQPPDPPATKPESPIATSTTAATATAVAVPGPARDEPSRPSWRPAGPGYPPTPGRAPATAGLAGVLGIALGLTLGLFGVLLLIMVSLQNSYGAPDRSFYRGTDSGQIVLGLVDFGLAACCAVGGIGLMNGRLAGRIALTVGGWTTLLLAGFWLLRGQVSTVVPVVLAIAAATMLFFSYQRQVTDWLGVLPPPQPE